MKKVLILYRGKDKIDNINHRNNYELLHKMGMEKGIRFYRGNVKDYQKDKFRVVQSFENGQWTRKTNIKPDIVIDKCVYSATEKENNIKKEISKKAVLINDIYFNRMFKSKFITYSILSDYMPLTFIAHNKEDLANRIDKIRSKKVVIKPDDGLGGRGVFVMKKSEVKKMNTTKIKFPTIVQEFIDSSHGIRGIVKGTHDLRVIFINHHPTISYIREPAGNSLVSNVSLGGKREILDLSLVPKRIKNELKAIVNKMKLFENTIYSIDFIVDKNNNPYILEINSPPSFHVEDRKSIKILYNDIIKFLTEVKI